MPSRNSFSIRKLFSSPGRLSLIADEAVPPPTDDQFLHSNSNSNSNSSSSNNGKRHSDTSTSSALLSSGDSRGSTPSSRGSTVSGGRRSRHGSRGSSGSSGSSSTTIFHPDSSISITTPQAERGLTDNVDHELSQEEIDRIKAVVAAAAAAAASSLRLRMDEGSECARTVQTVRTIQATTFDRILTSHGANASTSTTNTANTTSNKMRSESTESAIIGRFPQPAQHTVNTLNSLLPQIADADTNTDTDTDTDTPPPIPRRKNRRIPQPIIVPPRNAARLAGARPARRSNSISIDRGRIEPETNKDKDIGTDKIDKKSRIEKGDKGDKSERPDRVDKKRKSPQQQQQQSQHRRLSSQGSQRSQRSQGRRGSLGAKSGNGKNNQQQHQQNQQSHNRSREQAVAEQRKSGRSDRSEKSDKGVPSCEEKQKQHEAGATPLLSVTGQVQVQSHPELQVQLAAGNSKGQQQQQQQQHHLPIPEGDKRHNRQTGETAQQTAPKNKQPSQGRQDKSKEDKDEKDKQKDAAADGRRAAWQHDQHGDAPSSSTLLSTLSSSSASPSASPSASLSSSVMSPSVLPSSSPSSLSKTPPVLPPLPLYTTIPLASIVKPSSRASLPARAPPNLLSKALPPPPPPRVSSYFATRPSWKSKTEKSQTENPKTEKPKTTEKSVTASKTTDTDTNTHIHPLYRGQNGESDSKKDSGIALDRSQTSLDDIEKDSNDFVSEKDNSINSNVKKKVVTTHIVIDSDSDSDAGSCIDLLQALAIQPEEADLLRRPTAESSISDTSTMMQSSSLLTVDSDSTANANAADGPDLRDVCTTPTFTQPRMAPTPSPSAVPSETHTPRRVMSPTPSPRPSFMGPTSRTSDTFSPSPPSPKKQGTRFLPLRLNKGLPDAALRIQRKRSKKARKRERQAALNTKGQPFSDGKSQMEGSNANTSSSSNNASNNSNSNNSNNSGSSRWTLPDNVTELFNGRLFSRMEVTETLPFEKLQAIRESRALAQKQQEEAEEKKKAKQLLDEQDEKEKREAQNQKQQQELVDAEQALIKELQRPQPQSQSQSQASRPDTDNTSTTAPPLETLLECEEEELQVSPLDPDDAIIDAVVSMPVSPPTDSCPPPTLPMPPHIATQMVWPGDEEHEEDEETTPRATKPDSSDSNTTDTKTKTLLLSVARDEPDGSTTPIEPFHMEDLPSRIGAAGVRVSILLPVEEEEAYFASSVAQHKERRRREQEEREREEEEENEKEENKESEEDIMPGPPKSPLDEIGPFPSPPSKNPMRFQSFIKKMAQNSKTATPSSSPPLVEPAPTQPVPQVTVTDVDSSQKRRRRPGQAKASSRKSLGKTPKSSFFLSSSSSSPFASSSLIPRPRSSLSASSSTSSMAAVAAAASATPHQRDEETYVYLSATPFSLVMPTYRHGPIRLNRSDLLDNQVSDSRNSYDHKLRHHHRHPNIATVEETLDWTAFQMAILGGAGEFRSEVIDYGQISAAEQDEADRLADWFWSLDIKPERLLTSAEEDTEWVRPVPPPPEAAPADTVPPTLTHHTQRTAGSQWTSVSSSTAVGVGARGFTHSRTTTSTSIATTASGYSSSGGSGSNRDSSTPSHTVNTSAPQKLGLILTAQAANQALPFPMSRNKSSSANSSYAMSRDNSSAAPGLVSTTTTTGSGATAIDDDITPTQPRTLHSLPLRSINSTHSVQDVRASFASVASYESMPQSPMADLIMTRGADGKEYVAPMGYNLSHDLGDYLQWEKDNVYAMALEEPR